jgi:hypothetical protein
MRLGRFWFGRSFGWFLIRLDPFGVENAGLIDTLVSVRTEEVALCLQQIRWQTRLPITIEVSERGGKRGDSHAVFDGCRDRDAPVALRFPDDPREIAIQQEIVQSWIATVRLDNPVEKFRANDAPAAPDGSDVAEVEVPIVSRARRAKQLLLVRFRVVF